MITNADKGILITWLDGLQARMAIVSGTGVQPVSAPVIGVAGQYPPFTVPVLQAEDGSFVGTGWDGNGSVFMIAFNENGSVRWSVANKIPQIATADGSIIATDLSGSAAVRFDQNGSAVEQIGNLPIYSWTGNAYRLGSVEQVIANPLYFALSFWAFQGANQSANNTAHFRKDSISNDKVRKKLTPRFWQRDFAQSHCGAVFANPMAAMVPSYSLQVVQKKQEMTNFFDVGNAGVGALPLREVTGGQYGTNVTLADYLNNGGAPAATANMGYPRQTAVVLQPSVLSQGRSEFTLVHEIIFHAYAGLTDDTVFANTYFQQQGLWRPAGSTATANISTWMSTDCRCTPGNPATPSCQANTATW
jgi:hypothetical protein